MMKRCFDEKLAENPSFKLDDFGDDAVEDIMERLKGKRTMNNTERSYLMNLFQRAIEHQNGPQRLVFFESECLYYAH